MKNPFAAVDSYLDSALHEAHAEAAQLAASVIRQQLAPYNLKRHRIWVKHQHGLAVLMIGDTRWWELRGGHKLPDLLIDLGALIEEAPWAKHMGDIL